VWICVNCEIENDPTDTICNVCSVPRSARETKSEPDVELVDGVEGRPGALSRRPRMVAETSHTFRIVAVGGVTILALFAIIILNSSDRGQNASTSVRGEQTTNWRGGESNERKKIAEREDQIYRSARGNLARLRGYRDTCVVCTFREEAVAEIDTREREESAQREGQTFEAARGNLERRRAYANGCQVCAFRMEAEEEITQIEREELAQRETEMYVAARGDIGRLTLYLRNCSLCTFKDAARTDMQQIQEEEERRNPKVTFQVKSNHPNSVLLSFFSMPDKLRVWPGGGRSFILMDSEFNTYPLNCGVGERICYGAWVEGNGLTTYWGIGHDGLEGCQNCCLTCPTKGPLSVVLEPRAARTPAPTITWRFQSNSSENVEVAFYTGDASLKWPPGNQVFIINGRSSQTMRISCQVGQKICYGAWASGNQNRYWGVGFGGRNGCANCCLSCDGSESQIYVLNPG
jgi:hypothetical protein